MTADIAIAAAAACYLATIRAAFTFGLRALPQLRMAAPPRQAEAPGHEAEAVQSIAAARKGAA